ncbi:hypothetical protein IGJ02_002584 [Enterococcus sp. DIV0724b]|uniref:transposase n=1 Tax=Enterococcus sp. DIV0724b TaxID=2774694 RepID=UPI003D2FCF97
MNYYEVEFKLKIVKEYLEGTLGGRALAKKYGLPSNDLIYSWKHSYQLFGKKESYLISNGKRIVWYC